MAGTCQRTARGGWISEGRDAFDALWVDYQHLGGVDWTGELHRRVERLAH